MSLWFEAFWLWKTFLALKLGEQLQNTVWKKYFATTGQDIMSGCRHFVPVTRNSCRSSVLLKVMTGGYFMHCKIMSKWGWWCYNRQSYLFLFLSIVSCVLFSQREFTLVVMAQRSYLMNDKEWCIVSSSRTGPILLQRIVPYVEHNIMQIFLIFKTCPFRHTYFRIIILPPNFVENETGYIAR